MRSFTLSCPCSSSVYALFARKKPLLSIKTGEVFVLGLKENIWMIIVTGMGSLITEKIKIPFVHDEIKSDSEGYCTLEQIIYHVMRCGLLHSTGEKNKIIWNSNVPLAIDGEGRLNISPSFIWGLALTVITCPVNKDERVDDTCWLSTASFKYLINDLWGKRESVKKMIKSSYDVTIEEKTIFKT